MCFCVWVCVLNTTPIYIIYDTYFSVNQLSNSMTQSIRVAKFELIIGVHIYFLLCTKKLEALDAFFPDWYPEKCQLSFLIPGRQWSTEVLWDLFCKSSSCPKVTCILCIESLWYFCFYIIWKERLVFKKNCYGFTPTLSDSQSSLVPGPSRLFLAFVGYSAFPPILSFFSLMEYNPSWHSNLPIQSRLFFWFRRNFTLFHCIFSTFPYPY